ncbi:hypothetical protein ACF1BN_20885 [Streptomyces sp. NPDC014861]|uniref:hypothetical protein n=1 Tax=Streptomyces sp. NPDC014861 TaxID=3364923 RepID=UPI0036F924B4
MTVKRRRGAAPVRALVRLIVPGVAALIVAVCGAVPASASAGTAAAQAGSPTGGASVAVRAGAASGAVGVGAASGAVGVAASAARAGGYAWRTYTVGVYPWAYCHHLGAYYQAYYTARGYRASYQCLYWGGVPPLQQGLLRVTLGIRAG